MMDFQRVRLLAVPTILLCCAACSLSSLRSTIPATPSGSFEAAVPADRGAFLFVAGFKVSQYALGGSDPLRTVRGSSAYAGSMTLDSLGNLFVLAGSDSGDEILPYRARDLKREPVIYTAGGGSIVADSKGNLYVAGLGILVYPPGYQRPLYQIRRKARISEALAIDPSGDLYSDSVDYISTYAPTGRDGRMKWLRSFRDGVHDSDALAFGPSGELFVANRGDVYERRPHADVAIYAPGATQPSQMITAGIEAPIKLAVDSKGRLYVACEPTEHHRGWVSVYAPGGTQPLRKITNGVDGPSDLAVDPSDNLYVANFGAHSVTVYSPGGAKLLRTIRKGLDEPTTMVIGSL
jgi:sugar lactone lactonase YvrE